MTKPPYPISAADGSLWGLSGGQLEYVGQTIFYRRREDGRFEMMIRLKFTDHDMRATAELFPEIEPGVHYIIEVPIGSS